MGARSEEATRHCDTALAHAFEVLGKRWNAVLISALASGPAGFSELSRAVGGISDSMLSERLSELAAVGLVRRAVAPGPPVTVSYCLTSAGVALMPALGAISAWAEEHMAGGCSGQGDAPRR